MRQWTRVTDGTSRRPRHDAATTRRRQRRRMGLTCRRPRRPGRPRHRHPSFNWGLLIDPVLFTRMPASCPLRYPNCYNYRLRRAVSCFCGRAGGPADTHYAAPLCPLFFFFFFLPWMLRDRHPSSPPPSAAARSVATATQGNRERHPSGWATSSGAMRGRGGHARPRRTPLRAPCAPRHGVAPPPLHPRRRRRSAPPSPVLGAHHCGRPPVRAAPAAPPPAGTPARRARPRRA